MLIYNFSCFFLCIFLLSTKQTSFLSQTKERKKKITFLSENYNTIVILCSSNFLGTSAYINLNNLALFPELLYCSFFYYLELLFLFVLSYFTSFIKWWLEIIIWPSYQWVIKIFPTNLLARALSSNKFAMNYYFLFILFFIPILGCTTEASHPRKPLTLHWLEHGLVTRKGCVNRSLSF